MTNSSYEIDYKKWGKVLIRAQFIIACFIFVTEVVGNTMLYVTRSQGYGPDTIYIKLARYLLLTTVINFGLYFFSKIIEVKVEDEKLKRFLLMLSITLMCTDVAYSHYQFANTFAIMTIPIIISIMYEDWGLSCFTFVICMIGETIAVVSRATDPGYNTDIGPEAAIAYAINIAVFVFARMIIFTLSQRRNEVRESVIKAEKANANAEKMAFSFKMLETLASTIDAKDKYTNGHSMRVAIYATMLAEALDWEPENVSKLRYEALLHDIGKIGVPDAILNKPSKLSDVEFGLIKSHTVVGSDILKNMVAVPNASDVARYHHERFDGKGYPSGLKEYEIPLNARIVCIADAYDAMNSDRIYRRALPKAVIREELIKGRGTQFDPDLLDVFLRLFDENKLEIKADSMTISLNDSAQQGIMEDIEKVIGRLTAMDEHTNAIKEFDMFFEYMKSIGERYNRSIEVLTIDLERTEDASEYRSDEEISDILQIAIRKNIRAVDVYYRYSTTRHMVILLDAGVDNIEVIKNRILFDYDSNEMSAGYKVTFSLSESIEAPNKRRPN